MWPPANVVQEHKRRANFVWISLVALIFGYGVWLIISTYEQRNSPTVSIWIEDDDGYTYPTVTICATAGSTVGYGCDTVYYEYSCASTIESSIFNLGGLEIINGDEVTSNVSTMNEAYPNECVDIDLSSMVEIGAHSGLFPTGLNIWTEWYLNNGTDSNDTDDVDDQLQNSEGVFLFFTDPDISNPLGSHNMSTFLGVIPFRRQSAGDVPDSFSQTDITMQMTESIKLDGTTVKTYSAGTISTKDYLIPDREVISDTQDRAVMIIHIWQPRLTHTVRKEIDPFEWAEIVGSIGGTWELILMLWGIFFIARESSEPELKRRDLVKAVQKGAQNVVKGATSITSRVRTNQGLGDSTVSESNVMADTWNMPPTATSNRPHVQALRFPLPYGPSGNKTVANPAGRRVQDCSNIETADPR